MQEIDHWILFLAFVETVRKVDVVFYLGAKYAAFEAVSYDFACMCGQDRHHEQDQ
jgi:hypothetical protein